jgi:hypothetical protein
MKISKKHQTGDGMELRLGSKPTGAVQKSRTLNAGFEDSHAGFPAELQYYGWLLGQKGTNYLSNIRTP